MSNSVSTRRTGLFPTIVLGIIGFLASAVLLCGIVFIQEPGKTLPVMQEDLPAVMDVYDLFIGAASEEAAAAAQAVPKVFWIDPGAGVPAPDKSLFGETGDPASMGAFLEQAAPLLDGQKTLFQTDIQIQPGSRVNYYLDDSIFAVTWRQIFQNYVYTISEVKIGHPSQFRRQLAGNEYNSDYLYPVSKMGSECNAVVAASADHYRGRQWGTIVYDGQVMRTKNNYATDVCYIDRNGDLNFTYHGKSVSREEAQKYVDDHHIQFSLAFGPILIDNGVRCEPPGYALGEVNGGFPRAALCQMDSLHYLVVNANGDQAYWKSPNIHVFAEVLSDFGVQKAYALDGGKTGTIAMNGKMLNPDNTYKHRPTSDIIYFASAIPEN